jgi:hypothetical protein
MNQNHNYFRQAQEASYAIAKIMAKKKIKSHIIAESVIYLPCCKIINIMFGKEYEKEILKICQITLLVDIYKTCLSRH